VSTPSKLTPTVFFPAAHEGRPADAESTAPPVPLADAPAAEAMDEADLITGVSLTFICLPLGGATAARGFEPFALP